MHSIARSAFRLDEDVEDAVQETAVRCWKGFRRYDGNRSFSAWAARAMHCVICDMLRSRRRSIRTVRIDEAFDAPSNADPAGYALAIDFLDRLATTPMSDQQMAALMLRAGGMSYLQIGAELKIGIGTVKSTLFRGREAAAGALEE